VWLSNGMGFKRYGSQPVWMALNRPGVQPAWGSTGMGFNRPGVEPSKYILLTRVTFCAARN